MTNSTFNLDPSGSWCDQHVIDLSSWIKIEIRGYRNSAKEH